MRATVASLDRRCVAAAEAAGERAVAREREIDRPIDTDYRERRESRGDKRRRLSYIGIAANSLSRSPRSVRRRATGTESYRSR